MLCCVYFSSPVLLVGCFFCILGGNLSLKRDVGWTKLFFCLTDCFLVVAIWLMEFWKFSNFTHHVPQKLLRVGSSWIFFETFVVFFWGGRGVPGGGLNFPNSGEEMELPGKWNHLPVTGIGMTVIDGKVEAMVVRMYTWMWPIGIFLMQNFTSGSLGWAKNSPSFARTNTSVPFAVSM